jgi:hypothetical protein
MNNKIKKIEFKHPELGIIIVNSEIEKEVSEKIGDVINDNSKFCYYHGKILKNEDGTFTIPKLLIIENEFIDVGMMNNSKGIKNYLNIITNKKCFDGIVIYPSAINSVIII